MGQWVWSPAYLRTAVSQRTTPLVPSSLPNSSQVERGRGSGCGLQHASVLLPNSSQVEIHVPSYSRCCGDHQLTNHSIIREIKDSCCDSLQIIIMFVYLVWFIYMYKKKYFGDIMVCM